MAKQSLNGVLQHLHKLAAVQTYRGLSDRELLERFVGANDEVAFTVLIERHGPMVLGVCRRALPNFHDAEDACQATFLVLARKAASIRKQSSLSSWLHGVACRVAANLKRDHARQKSRDGRADAPALTDPAAEVSWREVQAILDEEMLRLPERYRAPLILCYLECLTRDEAAKQLGLSPGTLHGRLERARDLLRARLTKRGLTLSAAMSAAVLSESIAHAALAPTFVISSTKAAMLLATGQPLTGGVIATHVLALTQEALKTMFLTKLKLGTAVVLCAGIVVALIGGSFASLGVAQAPKPNTTIEAIRGYTFHTPKTESDTEFIRRLSKDLRGTEPTATEIHFFVTSKDAGRRQKLIDLFIQERQASKKTKEQNTSIELMWDAKRFHELMRVASGEKKKEGDELQAETLRRAKRFLELMQEASAEKEPSEKRKKEIDELLKAKKKVEANLPYPLEDLLTDVEQRERILRQQKELSDQQKKLAEQESLRSLSRALHGVVEKIDPKDPALVSISIGSDAGLTTKHNLDVYRLKPMPMYLGKISIVNVSPQKAIGRHFGNFQENMPALQPGDIVSYPLTAPAEKK